MADSKGEDSVQDGMGNSNQSTLSVITTSDRKTGLIATIPHIENGGSMEMGVISNLGRAVGTNVGIGQGNSGGAIGARVAVVLVLVSSVTYWGVESMPR